MSAARWLRSLAEGWVHLRRAPVVALVAVLGVAGALVLAGLVMSASSTAAAFTEAATKDLAVRLALDPAISEDALDALGRRLEADPLVVRATYQSAEDERKALADLLGDELLTGLGEDAIPAPHAVVVQLAPDGLDEAQLEAMHERVAAWRADPAVVSAALDADHVRLVFSAADAVSLAGWILGPIVWALALFFVALSVHSALTGRAREIELLTAFGATDSHIYASFHAAGLIVGAAGAAVAVIVAAVIDGAMAELAAFGAQIGVDPTVSGPALWVGCVVGGVAIGVGGAIASVRRHRA